MPNFPALRAKFLGRKEDPRWLGMGKETAYVARKLTLVINIKCQQNLLEISGFPLVHFIMTPPLNEIFTGVPNISLFDPQTIKHKRVDAFLDIYLV